MTELHASVDSPEEISCAAAKLRQAVLEAEISPNEVMTVFDSWAKSLDARELDEMPGIVFLRMWLRRGTLEPIIARELGSNGLHGGWNEIWSRQVQGFSSRRGGPLARRQCRNPADSLHDLRSSGGQCRLVRIPSGLVDLTRCLMEKLVQSDPGEVLTRRIFMAAFEHDRQDLHEAMAQAVDGAMIWGGEEAVVAGFGHCRFPIGRDLRSSDPGYRSQRWTREHGAIPMNRRPGACALRAMFGSLTSRHVPRPRSCFSKKRPASRPLDFCLLFSVPLKTKTALTRGEPFLPR